MQRVAVKSSNVASVGWEPGPAPIVGTLEIEFHGGRIYQYPGVSATIAFRVLVGDPDGSVGRAFHRLVRSQGYAHVRVQ